MTKKRIADLLKEEVEKTNETTQAPADNESQEAGAKANATTDKSSADTSPNRTKKRTSKASTTAKQTNAEDANNIAALEKQITELEASLKQAKEQISGLQDDIKTHQTRIFELKDELDASQKSESEKATELAKANEELETAKETIRQITAHHEKATKPEEASQKVIHGADLAINRNTLSLRNRPSSYKAIPDYAIQRGEQNTMLSDDDIGWVD